MDHRQVKRQENLEKIVVHVTKDWYFDSIKNTQNYVRESIFLIMKWAKEIGSHCKE